MSTRSVVVLIAFLSFFFLRHPALGPFSSRHSVHVTVREGVVLSDYLVVAECDPKFPEVVGEALSPVSPHP